MTQAMTDSVETLVWEYILSHSISGLGEIVDGEPRLVFYSPRFARLFYRLFASDARWRWGLIDLGYFNTRRVITMQEYRVRFAPRLDNVPISAFHTYGIALMYEELEDLRMDTTTQGPVMITGLGTTLAPNFVIGPSYGELYCGSFGVLQSKFCRLSSKLFMDYSLRNN